MSGSCVRGEYQNKDIDKKYQKDLTIQFFDVYNKYQKRLYFKLIFEEDNNV